MPKKRRSTAVLSLVLCGFFAPAALAASLYTGPAPRPGPDLLYAKAPKAPQLSNRGVWKAKPILVSGTTAYRKGEFLYQDYLYDDYGARMTPDPNDPKATGNTFSKHNGTYVYPSAEGYASNAADIVEFRVKPVKLGTAFRISLNTLKDPSLVAFTIAIGGKSGDEPQEFPSGANVVAPAEFFLTVHPEGKRMIAEFAPPGEENGHPLPARVDRKRRQIEVQVPDEIWHPRRKTIRFAAGVGLWDKEAGKYLIPGASHSETAAGGGGSGAAAFFNVAFRTKEPFQKPEAGTDVLLNAAWWRDRAQGTALAAGDISPFFAKVSFRKLRRKATDNSRVPRTGPMDRIYSSSFELSQGVDYSVSCFPGDASNCPGQYQGRLQPYAIYVPKQPRPKSGYGMTLLMHSLGAMYNQYYGTRNQEQFGERGKGSIVITPLSRGPDEFYENYGAADVFDVWADVARRYKLDPDWTVATGYSMGAIGSFKLAAQYPDLFARIQPTVGNEGANEVLASLRNVPVLMWNNHGDELVNNLSFQETADALDALGYRYELNAFQPCANPACSPLFPNHLQLALNDWYAPPAEFLGEERVNRNPHHVTYVLFPERSKPKLKTVADHAYWLSEMELAEGATQGSVDAISHGFGAADPAVNPAESGTGTLSGGHLGDLVFTSQKRTWGPAAPAPKANRIDLTATGLSAVSIAVERASVDCDVELNITSATPLSVKLLGCDKTVVTR
jgi:hypothetical protein